MENNVTIQGGEADYERIRRQGQTAIRRAILAAASRLLATEGASALNMRRVAAEVGCSTTVLYTLFGGKPGLLEALWLEGFDRLWSAEQAALAEADPLARLAALGTAYRRNALANPDYFRAMFGGALGDFQPSPAARAHSRRTFQVLVDAVRACIDAGIFRPEDPVLIATTLWATAHGVVILELTGGLADLDGEVVYPRAMRAVATGFLAELTPNRFADSPTDQHGTGGHDD